METTISINSLSLFSCKLVILKSLLEIKSEIEKLSSLY